jgi:hypothetical protein
MTMIGEPPTMRFPAHNQQFGIQAAKNANSKTGLQNAKQPHPCRFQAWQHDRLFTL